MIITNLILLGVSISIIIPLWILIDKKTKEKKEQDLFILHFVRWMNLNYKPLGGGCKFYTDGINKYDIETLLNKFKLLKGIKY